MAFLCCHVAFLDFSVGVGAFVIRLSQISDSKRFHGSFAPGETFQKCTLTSTHFVQYKLRFAVILRIEITLVTEYAVPFQENNRQQVCGIHVYVLFVYVIKDTVFSNFLLYY